TKAEMARYGFTPAQRQAPALMIPMHGVTGEVVMHQARPDKPRWKDGRAVRYEVPSKARMALDIHPCMRQRLGDPKVPIMITEGLRKADAATSVGLCCLGLLSVWGWRGANQDGGLAALSDWESVALNRDVFIVFDSDVMTNPYVHEALGRLKPFL